VSSRVKYLYDATESVKNPRWEGKGWVYDIELRHVKVMAINGNYAMVRRPGCIPYVTDVRQLTPKSEAPDDAD